MDAFFLTQILNRETYVDKMPTYVDKMPRANFLSMLQFIISLTISTYAVYLAWNAGSSDSTFFRILMSTLAFCFSTLYIIGYIIVKGFKKM